MGVRIQELPATSGIKKEDVLIVEDGQGTKKGTVQQLDETLGVSQLKEDIGELNDTVLTTGINLVNPDDFLIDRRADSDTIVRNGETTTGWIDVDASKSYFVIYNSELVIYTRI